jgi:hypothetical protein
VTSILIWTGIILEVFLIEKDLSNWSKRYSGNKKI